MKKFIIPIAIFSVSLFLFSFSPSSKVVSYEETNTKEARVLKEIGSFTEFEDTRYTADKITWNHRRQTWTDIAQNTALNTLETEINKH